VAKVFNMYMFTASTREHNFLKSSTQIFMDSYREWYREKNTGRMANSAATCGSQRDQVNYSDRR